ncbi:MAG: hypothetical protein Q7J98_02400 [Kiritimatiellia bacterium]|nr:hypothetical protein [Kiritimatiellia bacterium]
MTPQNIIKQLISSGLMLIALSYCGAKTDETESKVRRLEADIPSLYLINGIFFSADQNKQFADLLRESVRIHEQNQQAIQLFIIGHQNETDQLLEQLVSGRKETTTRKSVSGKARQARELRKMRAEWQDLVNRQQNGLDEPARKTLALLTPAQRDILDRFVPCFIPPGDFRNPERVGQADAGASLGENMLARLRRSPPEKLNDTIERSLDGLVPYIMKEQHTDLTKPQMGELRDELRPPLKELTDRVRGMNDSDFELEKANLIRQFLELQNAGETGRQSGGNELWKIKHYLLNPGIASVIARRAGDISANSQKEVTPAAGTEILKQKKGLFPTVSLFNSLQLTTGQARQLLPCVQKAVAARAEIADEAAGIYPQALKAYEALKKELENQQSSPQAEQEAGKYHHQLKMLSMEKLSRTILECQAEMDRVLSADQVAFLDGRQGGKQNDRRSHKSAPDGIALVRARAKELFDTIDNMSEKELAANCHKLSVKFIEDCAANGAFEPEAIDRNAEIERVWQIITQTRKTRRPEYLKNRDDFIAEVCPRRNMPRPAYFGWQKAMGDQLEVVTPSTQLLLSQTGLTLLEKKIKADN